jgi:hypothetical protein
MPRTPLLTRLCLDHVRCHEDGDGFGSAEPYLWTVYFKIDGDTVTLGDDFFLHGTCTVVGTPGSHGNLGDTDVDSGDDVIVPRAIGEHLGRLTPIPLAVPVPGVDDAGAIAGVVMILMEEDQVTDDGAEVGHARLNQFIEEAINSFILPVGVRGTQADADTKLGVNKQEVTDADIKDLTDRALDVIKSAILDAQSTWDNVWTVLDADDKLGVKVLTFGYDALTNNYWDINERFQTVVNTTNGPVLTDDWQIFGEAQGIQPDHHGAVLLRPSEQHDTPPAAGAPAALALPALGSHNVIYRDTGGQVRELWSDVRGGSGTTDLTAAAGAPGASGEPSAYLDTSGGLELVLYRGNDGDVHSLYWSTGAVGHDNLTGSVGAPKAAGNPCGFFNPSTGNHHVVYRKSNNHLHVLWWAGAEAVSHVDLTASVVAPAFPAPPAAGDPSAYLDTARGNNIVVYRADDGHIHSLYWAGGPIGHDDLSGYAGTPLAQGDPAAYYLASADTHQVTYRSVDGHLWELWWAGDAPVQGWDLTTAAGAPPAVSDPAVFYSAATNTKRIVYVGPFGHLFEIRWVPGGAPSSIDLTLPALAPRAAGRPAFVLDAYGNEHVAFRGTDNQVYEIRRPPTQTDWRWCDRCQGLYFGGGVASSRCPAGGTHTAPGRFSSSYGLPFNLTDEPDHQSDWRWCNKCQGLYYGGGVATSSCAAGGTHAPASASGSADYVLPFTSLIQGDLEWHGPGSRSTAAASG